jgi:hypothetical protein
MGVSRGSARETADVSAPVLPLEFVGCVVDTVPDIVGGVIDSVTECLTAVAQILNAFVDFLADPFQGPLLLACRDAPNRD